jgi:hypothetical protein
MIIVSIVPNGVVQLNPSENALRILELREVE